MMLAVVGLAAAAVGSWSANARQTPFLWNVGGGGNYSDGELPATIAQRRVLLLTSYYGRMPCLDCSNHGHQWCADSL